MLSRITIYCDGGSRGNPGEASYGFAVLKDEKTFYEEGKRIGFATNNVAEYAAVIAAFKYLLTYPDIQYDEIQFYLDSMLVVNQMNGSWKIKSESLREMLYTAKSLQRELNKKVTFTAIPREKNTLADRQVNLALDDKI